MEKWQIYIQEVVTHLEFAEKSFRDFENSRERQDVRGVFCHLHHFIVHVTNVDKLLDPKPNSPRADCLANHIDVSGMDLKPIRRLRNHMEHFDERLDMWVDNYDGHAFFDLNIVTGKRVSIKGIPSCASW